MRRTGLIIAIILITGCSAIPNKIAQRVPKQTIETKKEIRDTAAEILILDDFNIKYEGDWIIYTEWKNKTSIPQELLNIINQGFVIADTVQGKCETELNTTDIYFMLGIIIKDDNYFLFGKEKKIIVREEIMTSKNGNKKRVREEQIQIYDIDRESKEKKILEGIAMQLKEKLKIDSMPVWIDYKEEIFEEKIKKENESKKVTIF